MKEQLATASSKYEDALALSQKMCSQIHLKSQFILQASIDQKNSITYLWTAIYGLQQIKKVTNGHFQAAEVY